MPTEDIYPDQAPTQGSELTGIVEAVAEVTHSSATKGDKFLGAGRLYEKGVLCKEVVLDEKFQEVGGFSVLKTQASLYKEIWLNYGHIASNQVLTDLYYYSQVVVVSEIMTSIVDMNRYHLEQVSSEMIDSWETKIEVAEKLEFNIGWLRERLEDIKKKFAEEKKLQDTLREQVQTKAQVIEAEQQFILAKEQLLALETKVFPLLMERQNFIGKCSGGLLLLNCGTNLSLVTGSSGEGCNYDRRTY
ncbi:MATH domain and coiled-coil domain-containing protein At3g58200-like [Papaver somniferum]|uniref:MATH domain and coiled-coil domain-containing protein At3g58200-like n=1 Tax=Papaver somniferum TaxID=3469 RepID=UPI000E6FB359|nr:MATH domain and coiled-coil domain-containing protein At3g58200-like [Papaver somniferum]